MKKWLFFCLWAALPLLAQVNTGELRVRVTDPSGLPVRTAVEVKSSGNEYDASFTTDDAGRITAKTLPYGVYQVRIRKPGFLPVTTSIEVHSSIPVNSSIQLALAPVATEVKVQGQDTLIDPDLPSSVMRIGKQEIENRVSSLPGRSLQDLVNSQPGWLYEGNAVLHPRGAEYQTQFVIDGLPLTDNRSPSYGPEIEADDVDSMSIYTAGFPAEYGRKMGGVIEINTKRETEAGVHGRLVLSGGSYATAGSYGEIQNVWGKNTLGASANGSMTAHYLNPVVPENFTNQGTNGDFSVKYERDPTESDRVIASVRHELSRFDIPNEFVQQQAGQRQTGNNLETIGTVNYQHIFSADTLGYLAGMVRDKANNLNSNSLSIPLIAFQHNDFREGYFKGTLTVHHGRQEWKTGVESDATFLHENFRYSLTEPAQFDPGTPEAFQFQQSHPDLEQAVFAEDLIRLGAWTISAGLRWDHYQLLLNQSAFSPRLSVGRYLAAANMVLHASYDRVFQTPDFENILLSNSAEVHSLSPNFLRLPVQPSKGNYYEGGLSKGFAQVLRIDANVFRRDFRNFADDNQLLNTSVSYPIAFDKALIYGAEGKLTLTGWRNFSGFASYSYMLGNAWYPVTGGLFLGQDVASAQTEISGHFPITQDQRNTVRARLEYQVAPRLWLAGGFDSGSGLPFQFQGTYQDALAQYGPQVVSRLNFDRGRVDPSLSVNASLGADLWKSGKRSVRLQADGENLNNRLNVIDFGGLFSGNAIAPARSFGLRLTSSF
ncbi:MAG TPA: TonB-dependent receptor [Acidobacteriaceae bacterium]|nr:TonB-dependent receptor [Acidobacteriaceae bacterium]